MQDRGRGFRNLVWYRPAVGGVGLKGGGGGVWLKGGGGGVWKVVEGVTTG